MVGLKIIVVGAGIGGLAAARALALRGAEVTVLEQADAIREVGAGLQISPNGFVVLDALGLGEALKACSVRGKAVSLRDYSGPEVLRLNLTKLDDSRYFFVHRADLIDILAQGARDAGVRIRLLQKVDRIEATETPVVHLGNGASMQADLVIGADGLHSVLRPELNTTQPAPGFTNQTAWRAVVPNSGHVGPEARVHMGRGKHLVTYPLRDGSILNVVAVQEQRGWVEEGWHLRDDPANLRAAFAEFCPEVQDILSRIDEVRLWGLFRHPVADHWYKGATALLGDAAHPTLPFMAQGAVMALEDAWVLSDSLAQSDEIEAGLALYQSRRIDRVRKVINAASGNAWKYHIRFTPLRFAAHTLLRLGGAVMPDRMLKQFDWIYGHDVTKEP